jgi:hypothetical protein
MRATGHSRAEIEGLLVENRLAGENLAHSRENNLAHVRRLVDGDQGVTLGIDIVHDQLRQAPLRPEQVLEIIASITGCSRDINHRDGLGYIRPRACYEGLREAAGAIRGAISEGATFIFASGHPKNMVPAYQELAEYVRAHGCTVVTDSPEEIEAYFGQTLALHGDVYCVTQDGEPAHTHRHEYMRDLLARVPPVGMAVADHGFAGAALNLGIPTVCVMDTNDPGVALAAALGAPVTVVPLNDNSPGESVRVIADIIREFIEGSER